MNHTRLFSSIILCGLLALLRGNPSSHLHAQAGDSRSHDWTQTTAADFAGGECDGVVVSELAGGELHLPPGATDGRYTSPVVAPPMPFNAVAPHWRAVVPPGSALDIEMRIFTAGGWSVWVAFDEVERIDAAAGFFPEAPLLAAGGAQYQYRLTLTAAPDGQSPILQEMTVTAIDATAGPTTTQAKTNVLSSGDTVQAVPQPTIISRAGWGADENLMTWPPEYRSVEKIVVHHTVSPNDYTEDEAASMVRAIYYYHAVTRGWGDIGYNYLVDRFGNIYQGRYGGPGVVGGHVYGYNYGSLGIGAIGSYGNTYDSVEPSTATLTAIADLAAWEAERSLIHPLESAPFLDATTPNLAGHRDYPPGTTACPGDYLYAKLPDLRADTWDRIETCIDAYRVDWLSWNTPPPTLLAGETYSPTVSARNVGWRTWSRAGIVDAVRLGYHWLDETGQPVAQPSEDDHRSGLPDDLTFSHSHTFQTALLTTPITPGRYTLAWDMVHEGVNWFHDANPASPLLTATVTLTDTPPVAILGLVQDVHGRPVSGVEIALPNWITATSEADGNYTLSRLARDVYTLTARAEGHAALPSARNVNATGGDVTYPFVLAPDSFVNLVTNWDFESDLDGWAAGGVAAPLSTAAAHTGLGAVQLGGSVFSGAAWLSQTVNLPTNAVSPTLSLLYRAPAAGEGASLTVTLRCSGQSTSHSLPLTAADWTVFQTRLPDGWHGPLNVQITLTQGGAPDAANVLIDDVRLGHEGVEPVHIYLPLALRAYAVSPCTEVIVNGGFEADAGWEILETPYPAAYVTAPIHSGKRAMRAGIEPGGVNTYSYSSFQQTVAIPEAHDATLGYEWYPASTDPDDLQYLLLLDGDGAILDSLLWTSANDQVWLHAQADLSEYAGLTLSLRFGVYNDGNDDLGRMVVDDVSLLACPTP
ncbi:MAG: N-acetylmuramoyl-L-alanine amidase [Chloroflexota bacterium]